VKAACGASKRILAPQTTRDTPEGSTKRGTNETDWTVIKPCARVFGQHRNFVKVVYRKPGSARPVRKASRIRSRYLRACNNETPTSFTSHSGLFVKITWYPIPNLFLRKSGDPVNLTGNIDSWTRTELAVPSTPKKCVFRHAHRHNVSSPQPWWRFDLRADRPRPWNEWKGGSSTCSCIAGSHPRWRGERRGPFPMLARPESRTARSCKV